MKNKPIIINVQKFSSFEEMKNSINIDLEISKEERDRRHEKWREFIKELKTKKNDNTKQDL